MLYFAFILWAIYMANIGERTIFFEFTEHIRNGDKYGHFLLFGIFTPLLIVALRFSCFTWGRLKVYKGTLYIAVFVVLEELIQMFVPRRTVALADLAASGLGVLVFTLITVYVARWIPFDVKTEEK